MKWDKKSKAEVEEFERKLHSADYPDHMDEPDYDTWYYVGRQRRRELREKLSAYGQVLSIMISLFADYVVVLAISIAAITEPYLLKHMLEIYATEVHDLAPQQTVGTVISEP